MLQYKICPSILAADFMQMGDAISKLVAAGCDFLHLDIMDGSFVPQITFGEQMAASTRQVFNGTIDAHLMIDNLLTQIPRLAEAGVDILIPHVESRDYERALELIENCGKKPGLAIDGPTTDVDVLKDHLSRLELVLIATGKVGQAGQRIWLDCLNKVRAIRQMPHGADIDIMVDIGINAQTIMPALEAGANLFVASTAIFKNALGIGQAFAQLNSFILDAGRQHG